jgi:hypothetical protein
MATKRLIWVDVGMGVAAGSAIALLVFGRNSDNFVPMMIALIVAVVVWAFVAELAAIRAEVAELERIWDAEAPINTEPLWH